MSGSAADMLILYGMALMGCGVLIVCAARWLYDRI